MNQFRICLTRRRKLLQQEQRALLNGAANSSIEWGPNMIKEKRGRPQGRSCARFQDGHQETSSRQWLAS